MFWKHVFPNHWTTKNAKQSQTIQDQPISIDITRHSTVLGCVQVKSCPHLSNGVSLIMAQRLAPDHWCSKHISTRHDVFFRRQCGHVWSQVRVSFVPDIEKIPPFAFVQLGLLLMFLQSSMLGGLYIDKVSRKCDCSARVRP